MKTTTTAAWFVVIIGCTVAGVIAIKRPQPALKAGHETLTRKEALAESPVTPPVREAPSVAIAIPLSDRAPLGGPSAKKQEAATPTQPVKQPRQLHDPLARVAMSLVGADPDAEAYWLEAIYDSSLPDQEREDLIEDLNEEGLSDHKRPGPEDLPLIMNRIVIIQQLVPHADEFMLPHLREAYKDLLNLAEITQGGGEPVR